MLKKSKLKSAAAKAAVEAAPKLTIADPAGEKACSEQYADAYPNVLKAYTAAKADAAVYNEELAKFKLTEDKDKITGYYDAFGEYYVAKIYQADENDIKTKLDAANVKKEELPEGASSAVI